MSSLYVVAVLLALASTAQAQGIFGTNLVVNGGAEAGTATTIKATAPVASIPGWTRTGKATVLTYESGDPIDVPTPGPIQRGKNYFAGGPDTAAATLVQDIDVSAGAGAIDAERWCSRRRRTWAAMRRAEAPPR